jgi:hypothetical protein
VNNVLTLHMDQSTTLTSWLRCRSVTEFSKAPMLLGDLTFWLDKDHRGCFQFVLLLTRSVRFMCDLTSKSCLACHITNSGASNEALGKPTSSDLPMDEQNGSLAFKTQWHFQRFTTAPFRQMLTYPKGGWSAGHATKHLHLHLRCV